LSREFEKRLGEWAIWYHEHKSTVRNSEDFEKVKDFTIRAIDGCLELLAMAAQDIQDLENARRPTVQIMVPRGVISRTLPGE